MAFLKRLLKLAVIAVVLVLAAGATMYAFGWRVQLDGGGMPRLARPMSPDAQARTIEAHREQQRAQAPAEPARATPASPAAITEPPAEPAAPAAIAPAAGWSTFRGPGWRGAYADPEIRLDWPAVGLSPMWKQPIGAGYASFVVGDGRAYTIEQRAKEEVVAAYDPRTGRELWTNRWSALFSEMMGGDGPRATPTYSQGRVFALGAAGEFRAIDAVTGRTMWRRNILEDNGAANLQWGMSAAPLVVGSMVVVLPGGPSGRSVVAYDAGSGSPVWWALDDRAAYASPMLVTVAGIEQILAVTAHRIVGLAPESGRLLWEWPWKTMYDVNAAQPIVVGANRVFYSSGYDAGATVIEIANDSGRLTPREVWRNNRMKNQFTSSVLHEGYIYGLDNNILACVDVATGELKWKGGRYGYGQVVLAGGHLIVTTEDGDIALVRATPDTFVEITRFAAIEGKTWNHPAFADGILLVRNLQEMAAFDLRRR